MTGLFLSLVLAQAQPSVTLNLSVIGKVVSPTLYGLMTEEINHSYDGGLYAELIRNRAFLDNSRQPSHWSPVGDRSSIELSKEGPSSARPVSLKVQGGVANEGYWGIPVGLSKGYRLSVWMKGVAGTVDASVESNDGSIVYARGELRLLKDSWQKLSIQLKLKGEFTPTKKARLVLRTRNNAVVWLAQVSLFPQTYHSRPNGNRKDLMRLLVDMNPKFLRFPGGNYLEGNTLADFYPWKKTLGPIENRPGHLSPWGYRSTDGMGLLEYLEWCEDMKAKPVLAVYAGYALNGQFVKAGPELEPFVQDALEEIEYVTGGPDTKWGRRRIQDGHAKPFPLECVEVGNEDGFDKSGSYPARLNEFYRAIKDKYPKLKVISTTGGQDWLGSKFPITDVTPDLVDEHYYSSTWEMMGMATKYDTYKRSGPKVFVGEWASHDGPAPWESGPAGGPTPNMMCALADAAFMTGLERNSDVVAMACYAPLLVNVNPGGRQWSINMIGYDCLTSYGSPSYYAQKMFATNLGDHTVPITLSNVPMQSQANRTLPTLYASATRDSKIGILYLKIVNTLPTAQEVAFTAQGGTLALDGKKTVISGDPKAMNTLEDPTRIVLRPSMVLEAISARRSPPTR
jgi:alpha-N-arabinofuranosidase